MRASIKCKFWLLCISNYTKQPTHIAGFEQMVIVWPASSPILTHTHTNHYAQILLAKGQGSAPKHPHHPDGDGVEVMVCNRRAIRLQDMD